MSSSKTKTEPVPSSWSFESWPKAVYPGTPSRARHLVRANRDELIAEGVLARVSREIIIIGPRYVRWLEKHTADVAGYQIAPNRPAAEPQAAV